MPPRDLERRADCARALAVVASDLHEELRFRGHVRDLMDAKVFGDDVHVEKPKDEQRDSDHADECKHEHDGAPEPVGREVLRAAWQPLDRVGCPGWFGCHPTGYYAASGMAGALARARASLARIVRSALQPIVARFVAHTHPAQ